MLTTRNDPRATNGIAARKNTVRTRVSSSYRFLAMGSLLLGGARFAASGDRAPGRGTWSPGGAFRGSAGRRDLCGPCFSYSKDRDLTKSSATGERGARRDLTGALPARGAMPVDRVGQRRPN